MPTSDNTYSGGISFHSPNLVLGAANNTTLTGGFNFDLPLATVAAMTNDSLSFAGNANSAAQALFSSTYTTAGKNYLDTQAGAAAIAQKGMDQFTARGDSVLNNPNAVKPIGIDSLKQFMVQPGALPTLNQPAPLAQYQLQQQAQQLAFQGTQQQQAAQQQQTQSSGINWAGIATTIASIFL